MNFDSSTVIEEDLEAFITARMVNPRLDCRRRTERDIHLTYTTFPGDAEGESALPLARAVCHVTICAPCVQRAREQTISAPTELSSSWLLVVV